MHLLDIGACEVVLKTKTKENFERRLRAEHSMFHIAINFHTVFDWLSDCPIVYF